jgi:hypothetical protein
MNESLIWGDLKKLDALNHYLSCRECVGIGLAQIINRTLTCQEAIEAHFQLTHPTNAYLSLLAGQVWQHLVAEHIWGRTLCVSRKGEKYETIVPGCDNPVCSAVKKHWDIGVPLDQEAYSILARRLPERVRPIMLQQGWSTERINELVKDWNS